MHCIEKKNENSQLPNEKKKTQKNKNKSRLTKSCGKKTVVTSQAVSTRKFFFYISIKHNFKNN